VGSRAVLDAAVKRKIPSPRRESNPRTPIVQPIAQHYTDWTYKFRYLYNISTQADVCGDGFLAPHPNPKLEDCPLSVVPECVFSI
jgi:hypothetical protein